MKIIDYKGFNTNILKENLNLKSWENLYIRLIRKFDLTLFFLDNYTISLQIFYPLIKSILEENFTENEFSKEDILLLTITSFGELLNENKVSLKKLKNILKKEEKINYLDTTIDIITYICEIINKILLKLSIIDNVLSLSEILKKSNIIVPYINIFYKIYDDIPLSITELKNVSECDITNDVFITKSLLSKYFLINLYTKLKTSININESLNIINMKELNKSDIKIINLINKKDCKASNISKLPHMTVNKVFTSISKLTKLNLIHQNQNKTFSLTKKGKDIINNMESLDESESNRIMKFNTFKQKK
jgi:predicted transcriptional regulator